MIMKRKLYFICFSLLCIIYGCQKDNLNSEEVSLISQNTEEDYDTFAKSFASVIDNKEVRAALKVKALEKFDGDYDVLVKDFVLLKLKDGRSILDLLNEKNKSIKSIIENNPLLTIFVPKLEIFTAETWNTEKEIPIVALRNLSAVTNEIIAYDINNNVIKLDKRKEPEIPTILIKQNEIVPIISDKNTQVIKPKSYRKNGSIVAKANSQRNWRVLDPLAPRVLEAINKNIPLTNIRDYVYYGLDPSNNVTKSKLTGYDYAEHIISIELTDKLVLDKIADWGEGNLEIKITVNMLQKDGTVLKLNKALFPTKDDLYQPPVGRNAGYLKPFVSFEPIALTTWDNYTLGNMWTFHAEEVDSGDEKTEVKTIENTFTVEGGGSFEANIIGIFKLGFSGKGSSIEKKTETVTIKSTNNSDDLYDAMLNYLEPVAKLEKVGRESYVYRPHYLNTGAIKIRVEPYPTGGF